jgi:DNA polymerase elongation subunit (family B)
MAERDPGNKPQLNDRIPYVAIEVITDKKLLQGDLIEHPDYILRNNLKIDYVFYLTNQIMNPCVQFLELIVDEPKKIFDEYINKSKKIKNNFFEKTQKDKFINNMVTNYGFKIKNDNNDDDDWNIDNIINFVKNKK